MTCVMEQLEDEVLGEGGEEETGASLLRVISKLAD